MVAIRDIFSPQPKIFPLEMEILGKHASPTFKRKYKKKNLDVILVIYVYIIHIYNVVL